MGGGSIDPKTNLMLAAALKKAKDQGVPKENIEKAIAKVNKVSNHTQVQFLDSSAYTRQTIQKRKGDHLLVMKRLHSTRLES